MCAAVAPARIPTPWREEGTCFWDQLITECQEQVQCINSALAKHAQSPADSLEFRAAEHLQLIRARYPSTTVEARLEFEPWGPVIKVSIRGHQRPDFGFYPEDFDMPLAIDSDGSTVAVFDEGKSLRPKQLAAYLAQTFRRCFPRIALPCSHSAVA